MSMTVLYNLLVSLNWWLLQPDSENKLLVGGSGSPNVRAIAAQASDGSLGLVYLPTHRPIAVDLSQFSGDRFSAGWYDPSSGSVSPISGSPFPRERRKFTPPGMNDMWLLTGCLSLLQNRTNFKDQQCHKRVPLSRHLKLSIRAQAEFGTGEMSAPYERDNIVHLYPGP
jgi:hypothetical protein